MQKFQIYLYLYLYLSQCLQAAACLGIPASPQQTHFVFKAVLGADMSHLMTDMMEFSLLLLVSCASWELRQALATDLFPKVCPVCLAGFNPVWEETLTFTIHMPEIALVRFLVWDHDPIGRDFVGQRTVAFSSLVPGESPCSPGHGNPPSNPRRTLPARDDRFYKCLSL